MRIVERDYGWARPLVKRSGPPRGITYHHDAFKGGSTPSQVHSWHLNRGWTGFGYHFHIARDGTITRGRPEWAIGSHTMHVNDRIGVVVAGNLEVEKMTPEQKASLTWLRGYLRTRYGSLQEKRHRDFAPTSCPGENFPWPLASVAKPSASRRYPGTVLKAGAETNKAADVRWVQRRIIAHGIPLPGSMTRKGALDGIYGPEVQAAVKRLHRAWGWKSNGGAVGPATWRRLAAKP
jgi:N-acetylmuramoyl-L-alanine amidase